MDFNPHNRRLKIFTWHIHGSYLFYLSQGSYDIYIPTKPTKPEGYYGRGETFPFGGNVMEVPVGEVKDLKFDCILFQHENNFLIDQYEILSDEQRKLPKVYVEHNTPEKHPTNTRHVLDDPSVTLVHVTHFNKIMWDNGNIPHIRVIEHGVNEPLTKYNGQKERGIVVINHIEQRGRITGWDIFEKVRKYIPLDLVGMGTEQSGGLGEVLNPVLPEFISQYRFFFNPIRYTSFGLAVCEAMMTGMPIVALATTEYVTVIKDGRSGFIDTNVEKLIQNMQLLLDNHNLAREIGAEGQKLARTKFNIHRFTTEWNDTFHYAIQQTNHSYEEKISVY